MWSASMTIQLTEEQEKAITAKAKPCALSSDASLKAVVCQSLQVSSPVERSAPLKSGLGLWQSTTSTSRLKISTRTAETC
jgi:hypothetical protein